MSILLTNCFVVRHTLHVVLSEVKNTSLAITDVKSHLLLSIGVARHLLPPAQARHFV